MRRFFDAMKAGKAPVAGDPGAGDVAERDALVRPWFIVQGGDDPSRRSWGHGGNSYGMDVALHSYPEVGTTFICMAARDMVCNRLIHAWHFRAYGPHE